MWTTVVNKKLQWEAELGVLWAELSGIICFHINGITMPISGYILKVAHGLPHTERNLCAGLLDIVYQIWQRSQEKLQNEAKN